MLANVMQAMPYRQDFGGPFSVAAPLSDGGGMIRRGPLGRHMPLGYEHPHPFNAPQAGGYDSSGINPHGMYNGTFGQPQFPHNPGGFQPMGLPQLMRFNQQPSGLAALFAR